MVGDEGEEFRTDRRGFGTGTFHNEAEGFGITMRQKVLGFGTGTFHNEAEGRLMDGVCRGSGKDTPLMDPLLLKLL